MELNFKFSKGSQVRTIFGIRGIVNSRSFNPETGISYYVETGQKDSSKWYDENEVNDFQWIVPEVEIPNAGSGSK